MLDYRQLQAFATVIETQRFDKAARRLHLTQSAISQRVKQLEETLGQLLVIRPQPLRPTPAGQQLLRHYRQVTLLQTELLRALGDAEVEGFTKLAIGLNADSLATWFMDAISPLLDRHNLLLELRVDDQDQTHHLLRQGEVIGCISASSQVIQGVSCTALGVMNYRALATASFKQRYFPNGIDAEALVRAPAVEFNQDDQLQERYLEKFFNFSGDYPRHRVPSADAFVDLIARGHGWGMVPDQQSQPLLNQRLLQELSPGDLLPVPLYWHAWNLTTDISRQLSECLLRYCREHLQGSA